jgi:hypothetical protein
MTGTQGNSSLVRLAQRTGRKVRRVLGIKRLPELDQRLSRMERVFRAPRLTPELIAAIKLISPHFDLAPNERHWAFWEADQNGSCWAGYETLEPLLSRITADAKILEIGPGMGRSLAFFAKKLGWSGNRLDAYEGDSFQTWATQFEYPFCRNIAVLRYILDFNAAPDVTIFDPAITSLPNLPGPSTSDKLGYADSRVCSCHH